MSIVRAAWVVPVAGEPIRDGAVGFTDGAIDTVGPWDDAFALRARTEPAEDLGEAILAPGFIDVHCHLEWSLVGGLFPGGGGFGRWVGRLLSLWPLAEGFLDAAAHLAALRALRCGTTTLMDNGPSGAGAVALTTAGLRGTVHLEAFCGDPSLAGARARQAADGIAGLRDVCGPRVDVGVSPHAPYSAGPELWHALAEVLPEGTSWSTHIAESPDERVAMSTGGGPIAEAFAPGGMTVARWPGADDGSTVRPMARAGVLRPGLLAAHVVHVDDDEVALLAEHGVRAAHCPISNATLRCGRSPVERLRAAGVAVALGTDSPASAGGYDLRAEARVCAATHAGAGLHWEPRDLVRAFTHDAAAAIGRDDLGALAPGMRPDMVALRHRPEATPGDPCAALLDAGTQVSDVWVDGERLLRDAAPTRVDADEICLRAAELRRTVC